MKRTTTADNELISIVHAIELISGGRHSSVGLRHLLCADLREDHFWEDVAAVIARNLTDLQRIYDEDHILSGVKYLLESISYVLGREGIPGAARLVLDMFAALDYISYDGSILIVDRSAAVIKGMIGGDTSGPVVVREVVGYNDIAFQWTLMESKTGYLEHLLPYKYSRTHPTEELPGWWRA